MIGLVSVGAHIPRYRLTGALLASVWGGGGGGERAVANYDEDSLTMACEATLNALGSRDVSRIGACFLASTSLPYVEKSNATLLASVADLGRDVVTADLGGSLRCGTTALRLALDAVKVGSVAEAVDGVLERTGRKKGDITTLVLYAPDARMHGVLVRQLGFGAAMPKEPVIGRAGNTGSASCLLGLASALETAKPHDQILVVSYGNGAEALLFEATEALEAHQPVRPVAAQLANGPALAPYGKFLHFRRHVETEVIRAFTSVPTMVREERQNFRLYGQKCADCGAVSYPRRHLCWKCSSTRLAEHKLGRRGRVFTFTKDHLVPSPDPPTVMVAADLERSEEHTSELQSPCNLVCRLLLEKKKTVI